MKFQFVRKLMFDGSLLAASVFFIDKGIAQSPTQSPVQSSVPFTDAEIRIKNDDYVIRGQDEHRQYGVSFENSTSRFKGLNRVARKYGIFIENDHDCEKIVGSFRYFFTDPLPRDQSRWDYFAYCAKEGGVAEVGYQIILSPLTESEGDLRALEDYFEKVLQYDFYEHVIDFMKIDAIENDFTFEFIHYTTPGFSRFDFRHELIPVTQTHLSYTEFRAFLDQQWKNIYQQTFESVLEYLRKTIDADVMKVVEKEILPKSNFFSTQNEPKFILNNGSTLKSMWRDGFFWDCRAELGGKCKR